MDNKLKTNRKDTNNQATSQFKEIPASEVQDAIDKYNAAMLDIDNSYYDLKPLNMNVLVRCYKTMYNATRREPIDNKGTMGNFINPFPYDIKAVIIAVGENSSVKKGQEVILSKQAIELMGSRELGFIPVYDFMSEHYQLSGFLMIPEHMIKCIV